MEVTLKYNNADDVWDKVISISSAALMAYFITMGDIRAVVGFGLIYYVFGYAHVTLAHLYQWRAGKINLKNTALFLCATAFFYYVSFNHFTPFALFAVWITIFHYFIDEIYLNNSKLNWYRFLMGASASMLVTLFIGNEFNVLDLSVGIYICAAILVLSFGAQLIREREFSLYELNLIGFTAIVFSFSQFFEISLLKVFIFTVLVHYMSWYVRMFLKTKRINVKVYRRYIFDIVWMNALIIGCIYLSRYLPENNFLQEYFFNLNAAFVFVVLHILFTVRLDDYKGMIKKGF